MPEMVNTSVLTYDSEIPSVDGNLELEDNRPTAIKVDHVSMIFNMASERLDNLKEYFLKLVKHQLFFEEFTALDDISFEVKKGDVFGILGTNGSGKSTLLKIIAGVLEPTNGTVEIHGAIAPLIELGAGFDMDLSARENIYLNGALLGYSRNFIEEHFDEIVKFAEIEKFLDMPMKNYSSGMVARIAFAIATVIVPEILIVDEVLSVGDFMFQQKCEDRITELIEKHGVTVLIVSHSNDQIERLCNKAIWIERGHTRIMGESSQVCNAYRVLGGRTGSQESERIVFEALKRVESNSLNEMKQSKPDFTIVNEDNHYRLASELALMGWNQKTCRSVVVAPDYAYSIAVAVSGIAGALNAPVLPIRTDFIPIEIQYAINKLSPSEIYIVGEEDEYVSAISALELAKIPASTIRIPRKFSGDGGMLNFGITNAYWQSDCIMLCLFPDTLSAFSLSPLAYSSRAPFLISDSIDSSLPRKTIAELSNMGIKRVVPVGSSINCKIVDELKNAGFSVFAPRSKAGSELVDIADFAIQETCISPNAICIGPANESRWMELLSLGSFAGNLNAPILLEDQTSLDQVAGCLNFIKKTKPNRFFFVGDRSNQSIDSKILMVNSCIAR